MSYRNYQGFDTYIKIPKYKDVSEMDFIKIHNSRSTDIRDNILSNPSKFKHPNKIKFQARLCRKRRMVKKIILKKMLREPQQEKEQKTATKPKS
jgi:hypothetical protein